METEYRNRFEEKFKKLIEDGWEVVHEKYDYHAHASWFALLYKGGLFTILHGYFGIPGRFEVKSFTDDTAIRAIEFLERRRKNG